MKKNTMMRLASVLLIAVLMSTCAISGTFAKYVTSESGGDTAQVAKWGVTLTVSSGDQNNGDKLFVKSYETWFDEGENGANSHSKPTVLAQADYDVVAPGTNGGAGVTFTIKGKPEVATKLEVTLGSTEDVFLKYGVNNGDTYYPVVFTLTHTYEADARTIAPAVENTGAEVEATSGKDVVTGTLAEINAVLANLTAAMTYQAPGYVYDDVFTLNWAWAYDVDPATDELDTKLGNLAAGTVTAAPDEYHLGLKYEFSITITQVD